MENKKISIKHIKPAFEDQRGAIHDILDDENILHIGLITSKKGAVRGNHYHNKAKQFNYVLKGKAEFLSKDSEDPNAKTEKNIIKEGDFISIPPKVIHTIIALEDFEFLDFHDFSRTDNGYEKDVIRVDITK
ncbi:MAG: cupin domain-containing protein [Candidatus Nanoarchaeia archaeon]|jgi:quercetin dioxygenase-like cupin family protein